jgi:hypothetical protein
MLTNLLKDLGEIGTSIGDGGEIKVILVKFILFKPVCDWNLT